MKLVSQWLQQRATGKNSVILAIVSGLLFVPYLLSFKDQTSQGLLIDQTFNFNASDAQRILASYGAIGRAEYLRAEIVDFLFIPLLVLTIALVVDYAFKRRSWSAKLSLIPLIAGFLNNLKVCLIIPLVLAYPHQPIMLIETTNIVNILKIAAMAVSVILLLMAIITITISGIKRRAA